MASQTLAATRVVAQRTLFGILVILLLAFGRMAPAASVTSETQQAWEAAVERAQSGLHAAACDPDHLLWVDAHEQIKREVESGKIVSQHAQRDNLLPVPSGLVHHWLGSVFLPGATAADVVASLQDYSAYQEVFSPAVIHSNLISRTGDEFTYHLKFVQHGFGISAGLAGDFRSRYFDIDGRSGYSITSATNLVELQDAGTFNEHPLSPADSHGYLERLFTIVRYRQTNDGVYVEVETLSLSRDLPAALRWMAGPLIQRFSRQVMSETLVKLRNRVAQNNSVALALSADDTRRASR